MADITLASMTVAALAQLLQARKVSPVEVVTGCLERIEAMEPMVNAFITVTAEMALADARRAERAICRNQYMGSLHGIPWAVKDLFWTRQVRTTSGSGVSRDFIPEVDATVVARLRSRGATVIGKTNMVDHAYGSTEHHELYGSPRNPWNLRYATGGSSSGSAAAVAAGEAPIALGTDTAGSVRAPAANCGLTALKPTYGLVSRFGVTPLSFSQDHVGPLARSAEDVAIAMEGMAGYDARDPSSQEAETVSQRFAQVLEQKPTEVKIGVPSQLLDVRLHPEVRQAFEAALATLEQLGMRITSVSIPEIELLSAAQIAITQAEAAAYHVDNLRLRAHLFHPGVRAKLEAAQNVKALIYVQAQRVRVLAMRRFSAVFNEVDVLATPTTPFPALPLERSGDADSEDPEWPEELWFTRPFNPNGLPAISMPCGMSRDGLPIGLQIVGKPFDDARITALAHAYQEATAWHTKRPTDPPASTRC